MCLKCLERKLPTLHKLATLKDELKNGFADQIAKLMQIKVQLIELDTNLWRLYVQLMNADEKTSWFGGPCQAIETQAMDLDAQLLELDENLMASDAQLREIDANILESGVRLTETAAQCDGIISVINLIKCAVNGDKCVANGIRRAMHVIRHATYAARCAVNGIKRTHMNGYDGSSGLFAVAFSENN